MKIQQLDSLGSNALAELLAKADDVMEKYWKDLEESNYYNRSLKYPFTCLYFGNKEGGQSEPIRELYEDFINNDGGYAMNTLLHSTFGYRHTYEETREIRLMALAMFREYIAMVLQDVKRKERAQREKPRKDAKSAYWRKVYNDTLDVMDSMEAYLQRGQLESHCFLCGFFKDLNIQNEFQKFFGITGFPYSFNLRLNMFDRQNHSARTNITEFRRNALCIFAEYARLQMNRK